MSVNHEECLSPIAAPIPIIDCLAQSFPARGSWLFLTEGLSLKDVSQSEGSGRSFTIMCARHRKIDCELCRKTREWDELVRRVSKSPYVPTSGRAIKDLGEVS